MLTRRKNLLKFLFSATFIVNASFATAIGNPYTTAREIDTQLGRDLGAIQGNCWILDILPDDAKVSSSCLYSKFSSIEAKDIFDIRYGQSLNGTWSYSDGQYTNGITIDGSIYTISIMKRQDEIGNNSMIIIVNIANYNAMKKTSDLQAGFLKSLDVTKSNVGKPSKNIGYIQLKAMVGVIKAKKLNNQGYSITSGNKEAIFFLGKNNFTVNGSSKVGKYPSFTKNGEIYIHPEILTGLGCKVITQGGDYPAYKATCSGVFTHQTPYTFDK